MKSRALPEPELDPDMSNSHTTPTAIDAAIDQALHELQSAAGHIQKDADDLVSHAAKALSEAAAALAVQVRRQTDAVKTEVDRDVHAHPIAAAAGVALAAAALTGLVVASLSHKGPEAAAPPPPKPR